MKHELIGLFATGRLPERGNMSTRKKLTARTLMLASIFVTITTGFLVTIGLLLWQSMGQQEAVAKDISSKLRSLNHCVFSNSSTLR
jgi:methyl-accepting chemotaxis protein